MHMVALHPAKTLGLYRFPMAVEGAVDCQWNLSLEGNPLQTATFASQHRKRVSLIGANFVESTIFIPAKSISLFGIRGYNPLQFVQGKGPVPRVLLQIGNTHKAILPDGNSLRFCTVPQQPGQLLA
ncbi:hypothetical protein M5D96_006653 [Drosophila gunungcola]|uniref:Uncharacterized protein n=1 Tax=Drosophila gunungcola TaxID=103775 RepID=A0A9P9YPV9_9MUSC|nr:hypothetical protein M5D96_006653 [Drosophila gunungcola]